LILAPTVCSQPVRAQQLVKSLRASPRLLLSLVIITAVALDFFSIDSRSLWLDETFSATLAQLEWSKMWRVIILDEANSMLYHVVLHFWTWLGRDEVALRSLSALAAVAVALPLYGLMALLFDRRHGLLACFLLVINAFVVQFAQEARGYALALFLVTLASYFFVRAIRYPSIATWTLYAITGALGIYAHLYAVFVLAAHVASLPFAPVPRRPRILILGAYGLMVLLSIPMLLLVRTQGAGNIDFLGPPNIRALIGLFGELTGYGGPPLTIVYFVTCCAGVLTVKLLRTTEGLGFWMRTGPPPERRFGWLFVLAWLFVPVLGSLLISFYVPIYQPRYLIVAVPGLVSIASVGLMRLPKLLLLIVVVTIVGFSFRGLNAFYGKHLYTEDWRGATQYVLGNSTSEDGVVFEAPWVRIPFEYYTRLLEDTPELPDPVFPSPNWGKMSIISPQFETTAKRWLATRDLAKSRVWVVLAHEFAYGPRKRLLPLSFDRKYRSVSHRLFASITVTLYERR
jgi:mannosyltransferase